MKAVGATLCPPLRPAETEIMIRPPPLPTADHGCTAASWPGREGGRGDDLLATPLYLSHMSRPQLGQTWEDPGPTDLTLFASPSAAQCPPVSPALPSNRQDFFSVKFLIILWLGSSLEASPTIIHCEAPSPLLYLLPPVTENAKVFLAASLISISLVMSVDKVM